MNMASERGIAAGSSRVSAAIGNLRAVIVMIVVAIHAVIAYLIAIGPKPFAFDKAPWTWRTFPVVDSHRFVGFDIFCAWGDAYLMALFFLVSGFFVWPSLERGGAARFAQRRALRLGPPFLMGILVLMPIANYPAYLQTAAHPSFVEYVREWLALPFWPAGPMWFLWFLLAFDVAVAGFFEYLPRQRRWVRRLSLYAEEHPQHFLAGLLTVSALAYFPFGYPFGPMNWFQFGPFSFQASFPGLYFVYFIAGVVMGASGLGHRLLAPEGALARHWVAWMGAAVLFFAVWLLASAEAYYLHPAGTVPAWKFAEAVALPPACFTSCCFMLAVVVRFSSRGAGLLDGLQHNSFEIYLLHCAFVVWSQYALLGLDWPAIPKAAIVFVATLSLSWATAAALGRIPLAGIIIGTGGPRPMPLPPLARPVLPLPD
jgi:membrane-bound acyltransferase YfiQ involved in biofilm formation